MRGEAERRATLIPDGFVPKDYPMHLIKPLDDSDLRHPDRNKSTLTESLLSRSDKIAALRQGDRSKARPLGGQSPTCDRPEPMPVGKTRIRRVQMVIAAALSTLPLWATTSYRGPRRAGLRRLLNSTPVRRSGSGSSSPPSALPDS